MENKNLKPEIYEKVWGREEWIANNHKYCGKKLILNKGKRCSLHHHKIKDETFYLQSGKILMELDGSERVLSAGEYIEIPKTNLHRFSGLEDSVIFEFSTQHFDSDSYRVKEQLSGDVPKEIMEKYNK